MNPAIEVYLRNETDEQAQEARQFFANLKLAIFVNGQYYDSDLYNGEHVSRKVTQHIIPVYEGEDSQTNG